MSVHDMLHIIDLTMQGVVLFIILWFALADITGR